MPFALVFIGLLLVIAAYNNTQGILGAQLRQDLAGSSGFLVWIAAILIVGAIGYVRPLQTVSRAVLALILVVVFLANPNVFAAFTSALQGTGDTSNGSGEQPTNTETAP